jgi:hypothetical protein
MAVYSKYTLVTDPATGQEVEFGSLSKSAQQQILDQDYLETKASLEQASSETAADAVANEENKTDPATQNSGTDSSEDGTELDEFERVRLESADETDAKSDEEMNNMVQAAYEDPASYYHKDPNPEDLKDKDTADEVVVTAKRPVTYQPTENVLHSYASYTYGISLHLLSAADYKVMVNNPGAAGTAISKTLISSAMRYQHSRDPAFKDDFYFDSLKMKTVIGLNANSKGSNAIEISFTIIEPYGMTLLDRILDINTKELNAKNYLAMPYMLEVNFFGGDDKGTMKMISDQTKFIPIKIVDFKIKASVKGTEYSISAVPFGHQGNFQSIQSTKANFEVTAKTVNDFFENTTMTGTSQTSLNEASSAVTASDSQREQPEQIYYEADGSSSSTRPTSTPTPTVRTQSYTSAYNAWNSEVKKKGSIEVADQIEFVFDPEIGNADIVMPKKTDAAKTASAGNSSTTAKANDPNTQNKTAVNGPDFNKQVFAINAGTSILSVLDMAITNSSYIRNQLVDTESDATTAKASASAEALSKAKGDGPVKWYKVIPKIELLAFDQIRNQWGKKITYYVKSYTHYNTKDPRAPKSKVPGAVKDYQYIYTGHNKDIINFDMDFNALYFNAIQVNRHVNEATSKAAATDENALNSKGEKQAAGSPVPVQQDVIANNASTGAGGAISKSETQNAQSFKESMYSGARGDMLNVKLSIIGDPDFIKQDDILYNPGTSSAAGQFLKGNSGSLNMDTGEIFCQLTFNTPVDVDEQTGLLRKNSKYYVSNFSGTYKIVTVESEFRGGKFTQSLDLIRVQNLPGDGTIATAKSSVNQRTADSKLDTKANNRKISGNSVDELDELMRDNMPTNEEDSMTDDEMNQMVEDSINRDVMEQAPESEDSEQMSDADLAELMQVNNEGEEVSIVDNPFDDDGTPTVGAPNNTISEEVTIYTA